MHAAVIGTPPDNAEKMLSFLKETECGQVLNGLPFSVFGCGNSNWANTYQKGSDS